MSQAISAIFDYQPFGEQIGSGSATTHKFTGKERDDESGLDDFGARYYSPAYGRFMSADPPFIDQHPGDPQSWNLFAYVRNNPLKFIDPTGNAPCGGTGALTCQPVENNGTTPRESDPFGSGDDESSYEDMIQRGQEALRAKQKNNREQLQQAQNQAEEHLANTIYNETAGLRPMDQNGGGNPQALHAAREAIGEVALNRDAAGIEGSIARDTLTKKEKKALANGEPTAVRAYNDSLLAAREALSGKINSTKGATQFFLTKPGRWYFYWASGRLPVTAFGAFKNRAGGGDVRRNAPTLFVIIE